ncbi:MAG: hypothetical protein JKY62_08280 [Desulfocapsa sp.]|nr:hypothetical protein [Desulfocapsa sp.]
MQHHHFFCDKCNKIMNLQWQTFKESLFQCSGKGIWCCRHCGFLHEDDTAPEKFHARDHAQAHFELLTKNRNPIISGALGAAL